MCKGKKDIAKQKIGVAERRANEETTVHFGTLCNIIRLEYHDSI